MRNRNSPLRKHPVSFEPYEEAEGFLPLFKSTWEFGNHNRIAGVVPDGILVIHRKVRRDRFYLFTVGLLPWSAVERLVIRRAFPPWRIGLGLALVALGAWMIYDGVSMMNSTTYTACTFGLLALGTGAGLLLGMACNRIEAHGRTSGDHRLELFTWTSALHERRATHAHCAVALRYAKAAGVPVISQIDDDGADLPTPPPKTG